MKGPCTSLVDRILACTVPAVRRRQAASVCRWKLAAGTAGGRASTGLIRGIPYFGLSGIAVRRPIGVAVIVEFCILSQILLFECSALKSTGPGKAQRVGLRGRLATIRTQIGSLIYAHRPPPQWKGSCRRLCKKLGIEMPWPCWGSRPYTSSCGLT